ncbi:DUF3854 domain-containing protein [Acidiphilium acidophilum]|uniref:DUF3854 domain-containing protein n=1 Tax=Acidiphilium acidophilum TaxID=76588 RepID=UPI002E8E781E|nr:DUF3854 domain-containing protein [Acidiphilium acidophilum]
MDFLSHKNPSSVNANPSDPDEPAPKLDPARTPIPADSAGSETDPLTAFLAASGLSEQDCPHWKVVTTAALNVALGRDQDAPRVHGPAVEIPFFAMNGKRVIEDGAPFSRFRIINPALGAPKYLARAGSGNHLFIPHRFKEAFDLDHAKTLIITEGEKKAAAGCSRGIPTVAVCGVQQWAETSSRDAAKAAADEAGTRVERMAKDTPIMVELMDLIKEIRPLKIVVLFDADGHPVEKKATRTGPDTFDVRFISGKGGEIKTDAGKRFVLSRDVHNAAQTFAAALRWQIPGMPVVAGYVPHAVVITGRRTRLERQGLDDLLLVENADAVREMIAGIAEQAVEVEAKSIAIAEVKKAAVDNIAIAAQKEGYIPLGISINNETIYHVWSNGSRSVKDLSEASLLRSTTILSACGANFAMTKWPNVVFHKNEQTGEVSTEVVGMKSFPAQVEIISSCTAAGVWSPEGHTRGTGVWFSSDRELIINSRDGVHKVSENGTETVERCTAGQKFIYPAAKRGAFADKIASVDDVRRMINIVESGWQWRRDSDGFLAAGWVLMQAYVAALDARPHLYLTGESGSGKSFFQEWLNAFLGTWAIRVENGKESSIAGIRQAVKNDAITLLVDEMEPKAGATPEDTYRLNALIRGVLQMLRSAYSQSRTDSYSVVKGTAHGEVARQDVRVSAMINGIAESELEQADRNRMIRVEMRKLPRDPETGDLTHKKPDMSEADAGAAIYRRMWSRWAAFTPMRDAIAARIPHNEERMRLTLASSIAAYLVALGEEVTGTLAGEMIDEVVRDYCGPGAADSAPPDQETALKRLLALQIDANGGKRVLADAIAIALRSGLGQRGRNGGPEGDAIRAAGISARSAQDGVVWIFVAEKHPVFEAFSRGTGQAGVAALLSRLDGAQPARQGNGQDNRVKLGAGSPWRGVWVPTGIQLNEDGEDEVSGDGKSVL